ncbi:unnamed protein product, partial [Coccothraustes coccothraustes]
AGLRGCLTPRCSAPSPARTEQPGASPPASSDGLQGRKSRSVVTRRAETFLLPHPSFQSQASPGPTGCTSPLLCFLELDPLVPRIADSQAWGQGAAVGAQGAPGPGSNPRMFSAATNRHPAPAAASVGRAGRTRPALSLPPASPAAAPGGAKPA